MCGQVSSKISSAGRSSVIVVAPAPEGSKPLSVGVDLYIISSNAKADCEVAEDIAYQLGRQWPHLRVRNDRDVGSRLEEWIALSSNVLLVVSERAFVDSSLLPEIEAATRHKCNFILLREVGKDRNGRVSPVPAGVLELNPDLFDLMKQSPLLVYSSSNARRAVDVGRFLHKRHSTARLLPGLFASTAALMGTGTQPSPKPSAKLLFV